MLLAEAAFLRCSLKQAFLEISQNSQENTCAGFLFLKRDLAQVFFYKLCEISKKTFHAEHLRATASASYLEKILLDLEIIAAKLT